MRVLASQSHLSSGTTQPQTNGDEGKYGDYRASFSKALPHNNLGEVDPVAYGKLLYALETASPAAFESIPLGGSARLANPQAAYRYELTGVDGNGARIRPAPAFASAETAAEMAEVYWNALCRDVPFAAYGSSALVAAAVADLNAFTHKVGGSVSLGNIFRGETPGDLAGPYISQFLWKDIPYGGNTTIVQRYGRPTGGDYMTSYNEWLAVQRGQGGGATPKAGAYYIYDGRTLGEWVHADFPVQAFLNAALILLGVPNASDLGSPYRSYAKQGSFITFGAADILDLVSKAGNLALTGAWYHKWLVNRRQRPEVTGGRVHNTKTGAKTYDLHSDLLNSDAAARVFAANGTYLLPMAFAEGSPTHPAYPAGHACIAGACTTVLKAFFNEDALVPNPVVATPDGASLAPYGGALTIGGELNKLANNIALGRDWAGVHYRSEGIEGINCGEIQAIGLLKDYSRTYNESFAGFTLTRFNGQKIRISNGVATAI
ncbi:MAG: hypothetical protein A3E78_12385 [Alphaproteobacteria bacterium RIFCSPHIGHO2_12_FULL_63_12]|nr:MAG: hypothetical protein A3E78_12385 [Alphaproteobacteria bacterium RIFCSPHIGHO2_12_FULL_63_12]